MNFTLGDAIAALGLVAAVYGLMKPRWRLNFALNRRFGISVIVLVSLGTLAPFVAFSLQPLNLPYLDLIDSLAWVFFVCAAIDFTRCAFWAQPLYHRNAKPKPKLRFVQRILDEAIFASDVDALNAVTTIVRNSLEDICADVHRYRHFEPDEERPDDYAAYLLNTLLGETKVVNHIVENRIDFIYVLVDSLKKAHTDGYTIGNATEGLMTALYGNTKSYLYQQVGYTGLTNYASIYGAIFEDEHFVTTYHPLSKWYGLGQVYGYKDAALTDPQYVEVFLKGFTMSLEKFAYTNQGRDMQDQLCRGMYGLAEYVRALAMNERGQGEYDYFSPSSQAFNKVKFFVEHNFYWRVLEPKARKGLVGDADLNPPLDSEQWREGLSSAFARLYYGVIEAISIIHGPGENERMEVVSLAEEFLSHIGSHPYVAGIRKKILHLLWVKSEENITHGWYPVVFRALAIFVYWRHDRMPAWAIVERNKMIAMLRDKIKPRLLRNELMANKVPKEEQLLPECFKFDRATGKFYSVDASNNRTELRKTSALRPRPGVAKSDDPAPALA